VLRRDNLALSSLWQKQRSATQAQEFSAGVDFIYAVAVLFLALLAPAMGGQTPREVLQSFTGREFILFHRRGEDTIRLRNGRLSQHSGPCDIAVLVNAAEWDNGRASLLLETVGTPYIANKPRSTCPRLSDRTALEISGFSNDEPENSLSDSMRQVLKTPEEYLAANGIRFDFPSVADNEEIKSQEPVAHPQVLMGVDGAYTEEARRKRLSGSVTIKIVVGSDGRVHDARVVAGLGSGLDEKALRAISMWRFQPARQGDRLVARPAKISMTFRIL
jgi:TonB family protein